jgi:hypothetical protein
MLWSEVKKWAKENGYEVIKEKDDSINGASYYWANINNTEISGVSLSVSKLARDIYNSITSNQWIDHQAQYQIKLSEMEDIIYEG